LLLELLVILAQPEKKANMAIMVHLERKVKRATREKKEKVATMAAKVRKENLVGMDSMEPLGRLDIPVFRFSDRNTSSTPRWSRGSISDRYIFPLLCISSW
jgi:hypothetical protein